MVADILGLSQEFRLTMGKRVPDAPEQILRRLLMLDLRQLLVTHHLALLCHFSIEFIPFRDLICLINCTVECCMVFTEIGRDKAIVGQLG